MQVPVQVPVEQLSREGLRAGTLHSRGTALVLRHEGLARHHLRQDPNGGMSHQNIVMSKNEQTWDPNAGDRSNGGDGTGETLSRDAHRWQDG